MFHKKVVTCLWYKVRLRPTNNWLSWILGWVRAARCSATPRSTFAGVPSLVGSYTYGSERSACRRNISPVKSLARPPASSHRTPRLRQSPCANWNARTASAIERTIFHTRLLLSGNFHRLRPGSVPITGAGRWFWTFRFKTVTISTYVKFSCVCEKCMWATRPNLCLGVIGKRIQDGCHHKAACEHSKYRAGRMTQCKMGRFLSTLLVCVGVPTQRMPVCDIRPP